MEVRAVFLVGFMASGKSSVGQELARRLDWDFVDLDARIESRERQTISEIFRDRGEVVALGGGAFAQPKNRELLRSWTSIFLEAPLDELWRRSLEDGAKRPLRKDDLAEFGRLYESRLPHYRQASVTVVTSGRDPASLCAEIERTLQFRGEAEAAGSSQIPPARFGTGEPQ